MKDDVCVIRRTDEIYLNVYKILLDVPKTTDIFITIKEDKSKVTNCNPGLCMMDDTRLSFDQLQKITLTS